MWWWLVRTGESPVRAGDDYSTDLPIRVDQSQRIIQFSEQRDVERVERFWAVEGHECNAGLRARREYVLVGLGEGGHEPDGCTKAEPVL